MVAQGSQFSLKDVEVVVAQIDLDAVSFVFPFPIVIHFYLKHVHFSYGFWKVASLRGSISSFQEQASCKQHVSSVNVPYKLCKPFNLQMSLSSPLKVSFLRLVNGSYC